MKREYEYTVKVSIEEKPHRDRADSQVQKLLDEFEKTVRKINFNSAGSRLKVDSLTPSVKSKEMSLPDGQKVFRETSAIGYFGKVRKRIREL